MLNQNYQRYHWKGEKITKDLDWRRFSANFLLCFSKRVTWCFDNDDDDNEECGVDYDIDDDNYSNRATWYFDDYTDSRARWIIQFQLYDSALLYVDGKFNSKAGLFFSTFWFERSFCCPWAFLVFRPLGEEKGLKNGKNMQILKIGSKSTQQKERSNQKIEENKPALKLNFLSKSKWAGLDFEF